MPQMVQQMGGSVPLSDPRAAEVDRLGRLLLDAGGVSATMREKNIPYDFSFTLIDDPQTVNAFALPGGPTFVTTALYDRLENRAQLAGVIGHEIGHVIERHGAQRMHSSSLVQQLVTAGAIGLEDGSGRGLTAAQMGQFVGSVVLKGHSREHELESDEWGLQYLVAAGMDPSQMIRVMEVLRDATGGRGGPEFMQTHPHPDSRIEQIQAFVEQNFPDGIPPSLTDGGPLPR
jgi:predicted Zn-dependent protease